MFNTMLNDDCVLHIFSFLSPVDLLTVEKVCIIWKNLAQKSWKRVMNIDDSIIDQCNCIKMLIKILQRCGGSIQEFKCKHQIKGSGIYTAVAQNCPNIQALSLLNLDPDDDNLNSLLDSYNKLKCISLEIMYSIEDDILSKLFINNPGLEVVNLPYGFEYKRCLKYLPPTVKVLRVMSLENLQLDHFIECLDKCKSLHTLSIIDSLYCINWSSNSLNIIALVAPNLIQLSMRFMKISLAPIKHFTHLKRLFLFEVKIDDRILQSVSESCTQLEMLGVGGRFNRLTPNGLVHLVHLRNLRELILSCIGTECVSDSEHLIWYSNSLKVLRIHVTTMFTDAVASRVIRSCKKLEILNIDECSITIETIKDAVKFLDEETSRKTILNLEVFSWDFYLKDAQKYTHPLLNVRDSCVTERINSVTSHYVTFNDKVAH